MSEQRIIRHEGTGKLVSYIPGTREYVTSDSGETPHFRKHVLDPEAYGDAISSLVPKTCDVLAYDPATGRVLVANRDKEPQPADWVVGGRKRSGESDEEAALRNLRRELGSRIAMMAQGNLHKIDKSYDVVWDTREQPSTTNEDGLPVTGAHQAPTLFGFPVAEADFNAAVRANEEYRSLAWEDGFDVMEAPEGRYHPAFVDMVYDTLEQATRS